MKTFFNKTPLALLIGVLLASSGAFAMEYGEEPSSSPKPTPSQKTKIKRMKRNTAITAKQKAARAAKNAARKTRKSVTYSHKKS